MRFEVRVKNNASSFTWPVEAKLIHVSNYLELHFQSKAGNMRS